MDGTINLPEGYELDTPGAATHVNLPEGYQLDQPENTVDPNPMETARKYGETPETRGNYPVATYTDPSVSDAMNVMGVAGLAKTGAGLAARGIGAGLEAVPLTKNIVPSIGDTANDMLLKGLGARFGQVERTGGIDAARAAAKFARQAGADEIFSTERGSREAIKKLIQSEGKTIGGLRQEAGQASSDIFNPLEQKLNTRYNPAAEDVYSAQAPHVSQGLNTIKNVAGPEPTHAKIAEGITNLNNFITKEGAAKRPINALSDVANKASAANDAEIIQALGPDKGQAYLKALETEHGAFQIKPFIEKGATREALSRGGGHKGILMNLVQKAADSGGYRAASQGLNALHGALANPATVNASIPSQEFMTQQLQDYLKKKYGQP